LLGHGSGPFDERKSGQRKKGRTRVARIRPA
jgi:hypothetical protein